eukprot:TRINITY_DN453_c0_g3_i1.p1 TRINITY_DN453_c0_g3~~TRINITY_DN453_c0_g3_i1.p1  ORF type:complete len:518 (-),score=15.43 TRINITY_DN453_c0_g3_i1:546-2099(-)
MNQTPFNPPEGQLLFQKVLPAGPWLRFNNQEHIQLVDIICNGQLFRTCTTKLSLLDDLGQEFIVNINLQRKEEQGNEQIMVFTVGSLIKDKKLQQGDRLLFFSSRMGQEDMRHNVANQIRIRVKRGTCCRCTKRNDQGLLACCRVTCDKVFHMSCVGVRSITSYWECPDCSNLDQQTSSKQQDYSKDYQQNSTSSSSEGSQLNQENDCNTNSQNQESHSQSVHDSESCLEHPLPPQQFIQKVRQFYLPPYDLQRCFEALTSQLAGNELVCQINSKECYKCKQVKVRRDFFRSYFSIDGLQPYCRFCKNFQVYDGELGLGQLGVQYSCVGRVCLSCRAFQPNECFADEMCETCLKNGVILDQGIVDLDEEGLVEKEGETKKCLKCMKVRRLDMFWHNVGAKDGYDSRCKICKTIAKKRNNNTTTITKRKRSLEDIQAERERSRLKRLQRPPHIKDVQDFRSELQLLSDLNEILVVDVQEARKSCEQALQISNACLKAILNNEPAGQVLYKVNMLRKYQ